MSRIDDLPGPLLNLPRPIVHQLGPERLRIDLRLDELVPALSHELVRVHFAPCARSSFLVSLVVQVDAALGHASRSASLAPFFPGSVGGGDVGFGPAGGFLGGTQERIAVGAFGGHQFGRDGPVGAVVVVAKEVQNVTMCCERAMIGCARRTLEKQ